MLIELKVGFFRHLFEIIRAGGAVLVLMVICVFQYSYLCMICTGKYGSQHYCCISRCMKSNMRTVQIAAENQLCDGEGHVSDLERLLPFLPGGDSRIGGSPGLLPVNPVTHANQGSVVSFRFPSRRALEMLCERSSLKSLLKPGQVGYCTFADDDRTYAIIGLGADSEFICGVGGKMLILSNQ